MRGLREAEQVLGTYVKHQEANAARNVFINRISPPLASDALAASVEQRGPISGRFIAVKDNICTSDLPTTCGSYGLRNYVSPFDATVVSRLKAAGGIIVGKTNLDEFGMGSHSMNSVFGPVHAGSPEDATSVGGSSGGSAEAVLSRQCDAALGTDTGGSVRLPGAYRDLYAFKPSYGLVSRWGVVAYANSLDTVGFLGRNVPSIRTLFEATNAHDHRDPTSLRPNTRSRLSRRRADTKPLRIGVPREYNIASLSPTIRASWTHALQRLQSAGHTIHAVSLPTTRDALSAYYILAPAEASSNLAKYDSVRYGTRPPPKQPRTDASANSDTPDAPTHEQSGSGGDLYAHARSHALGPEVRRRILLGAYSLSAAARDNYFAQAQRVRRRVARDFDGVFASANPLRDDAEGPGAEGVDVLFVPTAHRLPPRLEEVRREGALATYAGDVFTVPASLAGLPAVNVPVDLIATDGEQGEGGFVGMQVIGQFGDDELVLDFAQQIQEGISKRHQENWKAEDRDVYGIPDGVE